VRERESEREPERAREQESETERVRARERDSERERETTDRISGKSGLRKHSECDKPHPQACGWHHKEMSKKPKTYIGQNMAQKRPYIVGGFSGACGSHQE